MNLLDRVRKICLALPGAYEKVAWSAPTFRVGERQFAMFVDDHHGVGFAGLWVKLPDGAQEELVASSPEHFYVPPYVGTAGWVGIRLESGLDWNVVAGLVGEGYTEVARRQSPKKIAAKGATSTASRGTGRSGGRSSGSTRPRSRRRGAPCTRVASRRSTPRLPAGRCGNS
jgi:predicted DNA-binding protein (MmcQ/YjbR family)